MVKEGTKVRVINDLYETGIGGEYGYVIAKIKHVSDTYVVKFVGRDDLHNAKDIPLSWGFPSTENDCMVIRLNNLEVVGGLN